MDALYWDAELMLRRYIYDYMVRKNLHGSAEIFKDEAGVSVGPLAISDSTWGFLLEWWLIFWDTYIARQPEYGVQQASNEAFSVNPSYLEHQNSQFMEIGSSSKEPWLGTQLQPAAISQRASSFNIADNIFLHNNSIRNNQQIKPGYQSANQFVGLQENWVRQSNFLRGAQQDVQPTNIRRDMHQVGMQNPQTMNFGQLSLNASHSLQLNPTQPKLNIPSIGLRHTDKNKLGGRPSSGVGSTSINIGYQSMHPWNMSEEQWQELQRINQRKKQQNQMQGFVAPRLGSHLQFQTVNRSDKIPPFVEMNKPKVTESMQIENSRKRKEPPYSKSKKSLQNREVGRPSILIEESASQTLNKSFNKAMAPEASQQLDASVHMKEGSGTENAEHTNDEGNLKDANVENHEEKFSIAEQQNSLDANGDNKNDQNKLNGLALTATEGLEEKDDFVYQLFAQDVSLYEEVLPEKFEIDLPAKEAKSENEPEKIEIDLPAKEAESEPEKFKIDLPTKEAESENEPEKIEIDLPAKEAESEPEKIEIDHPTKKAESKPKKFEIGLHAKEAESESKPEKYEIDLPNKEAESENKAEKSGIDLHAKEAESENKPEKSEIDLPAKKAESEKKSESEIDLPAKEAESEINPENYEIDLPAKEAESENSGSNYSTMPQCDNLDGDEEKVKEI